MANQQTWEETSLVSSVRMQHPVVSSWCGSDILSCRWKFITFPDSCELSRVYTSIAHSERVWVLNYETLLWILENQLVKSHQKIHSLIVTRVTKAVTLWKAGDVKLNNCYQPGRLDFPLLYIQAKQRHTDTHITNIKSWVWSMEITMSESL